MSRLCLYHETPPDLKLKFPYFVANDVVRLSPSYRVSARMPYSQDTGMSHTGFRCVKDVTP